MLIFNTASDIIRHSLPKANWKIKQVIILIQHNSRVSIQYSRLQNKHYFYHGYTSCHLPVI